MIQDNFLEKIRGLTIERVAHSRRVISLESLTEKIPACRRPLDLLARLNSQSGTKIIAEIKRRSPSRGEIASELAATDIAKAYERAGATAISVLTEPSYFGGSVADLSDVRALLPEMPLLMKDFVLDSYQLAEARCFGADAVLLIHTFLGEERLTELFHEALRLELTPLVEIHTESELESAHRIGAKLIGVNCRDLSTLQVDLTTTARIARHLKSRAAAYIAESGIETAEQIQKLAQLGYQGFLVGTKLMSGKSPERDLQKLLESVA